MSDVDTNLSTTSTPAPDAASTPAPASQSAETSAPSPSATPTEQGDNRESLLQAVQKAVPELRSSQQEQTDASATPAQAAQQDRAADDAELPDDVSPEELARYHPSAKRRIDKLIKQRRELKDQVERAKTLEPSAKAADSVSQYLRDNDIGRDDFLLTLELAAAMRRGDFRAFYEGVQPYVRLAEEYLGIQLPQDLQQRVREGHMTTQAAAAFNRERMDRAMAQSVQQRTQQQFHATQQNYAAQQQYQAREQLANQVRDTVNSWEEAVMKHDPDYAAKRAAVQDTMWAVVREQGAPQSPDHAVNIAREAYKRVNERYRSWAPPRRPTSRSPSSTGRTTGAAPEAKSLADAVKMAREGARL